jgi:mono/diheme cytochrome c family protein
MIWLAFLLQISNIQAGEKIFAQNCSVGYCHGAAGAAARGPRLRGRNFDKDYLYSAIKDGIAKSAMPAWKDRLKDEEILAVVGYVQSLAGATGEVSPLVASPTARSGEVFNGPPEAARGRDLFFAANRCGNCHSLGGRGTAVGPDLTKFPPDGVPSALTSTSPKQVRMVKLKDGESFPAVLGAEDGGFVQVFDLTAPPPVRRTLEKGEIVSATATSWKHPPAAAQEIADIAAYLKWLAH